MSGSLLRVTARDDLDHLIAHASALGLVHRIELLRSVRAGEVTLVELDRSAAAPTKQLDRCSRPTIVLLGDDDYQATGPGGWIAARRLCWWARGAMVHASGGDAASYALAIAMAVERRRFLLIETDTAHRDEWGAVLLRSRIPFVSLRPEEGVHPVLPQPGALQ